MDRGSPEEAWREHRWNATNRDCVVLPPIEQTLLLLIEDHRRFLRTLHAIDRTFDLECLTPISSHLDALALSFQDRGRKIFP